MQIKPLPGGFKRHMSSASKLCSTAGTELVFTSVSGHMFPKTLFLALTVFKIENSQQKGSMLTVLQHLERQRNRSF